jgi:hypothetical protein
MARQRLQHPAWAPVGAIGAGIAQRGAQRCRQARAASAGPEPDEHGPARPAEAPRLLHQGAGRAAHGAEVLDGDQRAAGAGKGSAERRSAPQPSRHPPARPGRPPPRGRPARPGGARGGRRRAGRRRRARRAGACARSPTRGPPTVERRDRMVTCSHASAARSGVGGSTSVSTRYDPCARPPPERRRWRLPADRFGVPVTASEGSPQAAQRLAGHPHPPHPAASPSRNASAHLSPRGSLGRHLRARFAFPPDHGRHRPGGQP